MATLQDLINLAKADGGKFFVIDESGEPRLVIMSVEDYQKLLLGKLKRQVEDVEKINREILKAQLQADINAPEAAAVKETKFTGPIVRRQPQVPRQDLRAEVIDPSFDFEGPKMDFDDF